MGDLTDPKYWGRIQKRIPKVRRGDPLHELVSVIVPYLRDYEGKEFLEIGCSPGTVSSLICRKIKLVPSGIDTSPAAEAYLDRMRADVGVEANLIRIDVREFRPQEPFDIVSSFGLVEHFDDTQGILDHHDRLCRPGGLIIVSIPNFRYVQWLYHFLLDRTDLKRHNLQSMTFETFTTFARRHRHEILALQYVGSISFWNHDSEGRAFGNLMRKLLGGAVQLAASGLFSRVLTGGSPYYSPWIVYVARKV